MAEVMKPLFKRCKRLKGCTSKSVSASPSSSEPAADRISQLSDATLAQILSSLNLKEAARCGVLSSRWNGLWKQITRLDFDESEALLHFHAISEDISLLKPSRSEYVTWVNQVLTLHESSTLDEFRVQFDLSARARKDIDQWIKFAISKRVKKLHIDLTSYSGGKKYDISSEFCQYLMSPTNLSDVKHLTSLYLNDVNINGELVEYLLTNCTHLERVDISHSSHLVKLKVVGPSLALKYLRLQTCRLLESIELSAPKLTTFYHFGKPPVFVIGNNPLLTELFIGSPRYPQVAHALDAFSNLVGQLKTLEFSIRMQVEKRIPKVPEFTSLRQLTLEVLAGSRFLMLFADLIFAAPSLEKFTLRLVVVYSQTFEWRVPAKRLDQRHECLKEIEVRGFRAACSVLQLLDFLFANTASLKKVILDPYASDVRSLPPGEEIVKSRKVAKEFKKSLPRGVKLVVM